MELTYIELNSQTVTRLISLHEDCTNALNIPKNQEEQPNGPLSLNPDFSIPLPYIEPAPKEQQAALEWEGIVNGVFYIALYEPKHEHYRYYKDFVLALEPELPYILRTRLHEQCEQKLWPHASDTARLLQFLLPAATWPLLELAYIYEQQAEQAMLEHRFTDCGEAWNLAALVYEQLHERDELDARCHYQLGYYYLQRCDYQAASASFAAAQQLALSEEHPLWGKSQGWLRQIGVLGEKDTHTAGLWKQVQAIFECTMNIKSVKTAINIPPQRTQPDRALWQELCLALEELLQECELGCIWYMYGFCLLYENRASNEHKISEAFIRARELGWAGVLKWQLPYYLGLSYYLEGQYRNAERSFKAVLQQDPQHTATWYWLKRLYSELEDLRSAKYNQLLQTLRPDFPELIQYFT